jgi:hypothetical protein
MDQQEAKVTSALKDDFMTLIQSISSYPGAMVTIHASGLFGCTARYLQALLASLGSANVTKAVDTGSKSVTAFARFSVISELSKLSFAV